MQKTSIEWTTFSANPLKYRRKSDNKIVWGCVKKSSGCANCYSEAIALRFNRGKVFNAASMEELAPFLDDEECRAMRTKKMIDATIVSGSRCFLSDMTDLFGEWVSDDILNRLFSGTLEVRTDVTWQLLTKRADRMQKYLSWRWGEGRIPPRNIHVGVSVENQAAADERIPLLLKVPAAVRFLSCEPLLGPVDVTRWLNIMWRCSGCLEYFAGPYQKVCPSCGKKEYWSGSHTFNGRNRPPNDTFPTQSGSGIDWSIVGGESGPGARPMDLAWARSLVEQHQAAGVPVFVKQLGAKPLGDYYDDRDEYEARRGIDWPAPIGWSPHDGQPAIGAKVELPIADKKGGEPAEWPESLRVREFPKPR